MFRGGRPFQVLSGQTVRRLPPPCLLRVRAPAASLGPCFSACRLWGTAGAADQPPSAIRVPAPHAAKFFWRRTVAEGTQFFDPIVDRKTAFFETAGSLGEGERVWVLAKMPDPIKVVADDECHKYLLLSNTHSGRGSVIVKFTAVRVVCQNTLMLALEDGQQAFRVRHSKVMTDRLQEIGELITAANRVYAEAAKLFVQLAQIELKAGLLESYLDLVFPKSDSQKKKREKPAKWSHVERLLEETPDLQLQGVRGTLWAAFNAVTRFEDYRVVKGEVGGSRLDRVWFGRSAEVKLKALQAAAQLVLAI